MGIKENLEEIGLTNQEAEIYISALKLGQAKASQIAQKTGIKRGGVYYTLKLLKEKGFVSEVIRSGVQYYSAVSPGRMLEIIEEERVRKKELISDMMDELNEMKQNTIEKPLVEIYEGYEGFKTIFSKLLERSNQEFRCYLSAEILTYLPHFHEQFRLKRKSKKIKIRTITQKTSELMEIKKLDKKELRETRFRDIFFKQAPILSYILDDAVVFIKANKKEQIAVYVQDKDMASLYKNIFDQEWIQANT